MAHEAIEYFLVKVQHTSNNGNSIASVQKVTLSASDIERLNLAQANEFVVDDDKATQIARSSAVTSSQPPAAPAPVAPAANAAARNDNSTGTAAWRSMPGGWATLAAAGVPALANHGAYPFHDGVARVAAGKIIPAVAGLSCTGMPGGWATLGATDSAPATAAPAQAIYSNGHDATATTAPTDVAATQIAAAPVAAQNDNSTAQSAWASMPGGWATLAAASGTALVERGAYPLHDGVARVAAGEIIPPAAGLSYTRMPGGWASLGG